LGVIALTASNAEGWAGIKNMTQDQHADGLEFARQLHPAIAACRLFCERHEVLNEVYLMMVMLEGTVLEMIKGDLSLSHFVLYRIK
jgi:hypothetical protein